MRVYFSAEERCMLRLGGAAAGFCGRAAKFADIGEEGVQAEFLPADGNLLPLSFFICDGFFREPPACCTVCLYGCGADVLARFSPREKPLTAPVQARADGVLFTVFGGAMPSLVLENGHGMEIVPLPPAERYEAGRAEIGGESFARLECLHKGERTLLLFNARLEEAFRGQADGAEYGRRLTVTRRLHDIAGHTEERVFRAENGALVQEERRLRAEEGFDPAKLDERVLPFAFFQELLAGGDPAPYLSPALAEKKEMLKEYLGGFCRVSLPRDIFYLTYGKRNAAALSYRLSENRYEAKFFEAVCEGGKVTNVRPVPEEE